MLARSFFLRLLLSLTLVACSSTDDAKLAGGAPKNGNSRFYVANTDSGSFSVIDHQRGRVVDTMDVGNRPHGQAPAKDGERLFATTDGGRGEVLAIETAGNSITWLITTPADVQKLNIAWCSGGREERIVQDLNIHRGSGAPGAMPRGIRAPGRGGSSFA